jgi:hypothetical protein
MVEASAELTATGEDEYLGELATGDDAHRGHGHALEVQLAELTAHRSPARCTWAATLAMVEACAKLMTAAGEVSKGSKVMCFATRAPSADEARPPARMRTWAPSTGGYHPDPGVPSLEARGPD